MSDIESSVVLEAALVPVGDRLEATVDVADAEPRSGGKEEVSCGLADKLEPGGRGVGVSTMDEIPLSAVKVPVRPGSDRVDEVVTEPPIPALPPWLMSGVVVVPSPVGDGRGDCPSLGVCGAGEIASVGGSSERASVVCGERLPPSWPPPVLEASSGSTTMKVPKLVPLGGIVHTVVRPVMVVLALKEVVVMVTKEV